MKPLVLDWPLDESRAATLAGVRWPPIEEWVGAMLLVCYVSLRKRN